MARRRKWYDAGSGLATRQRHMLYWVDETEVSTLAALDQRRAMLMELIRGTEEDGNLHSGGSH